VTSRNRWLRSVLLIALVYAVVGIVTAYLSKSAHTAQLGTMWRMAAWLLSFITFAGHVAHERVRVGNTTVKSALLAAVAVALGAFALAVMGPARSHWGATDFWRAAVLSVPLWPILTGVPAFLGGLVAGSILGRVFVREKAPPS
jgi:hypothetical protein